MRYVISDEVRNSRDVPLLNIDRYLVLMTTYVNLPCRGKNELRIIRRYVATHVHGIHLLTFMRYATCVVSLLKATTGKKICVLDMIDTLKCASLIKNVNEKRIKIFLLPDIFDQAALGYYVLKLLIFTKFVAISIVNLFSTCQRNA